MTICIGMLASDGVVIAADAQESDQYYKRSQQKILTFMGNVPLGNNPNEPSMACAFTGSGEGGYVDAFIAETMRNISTDMTQKDFQEFLGEKVLRFHEQHLFPLSVANNPPEIQILVGSYIQWSTSIHVSHGSTLRRAFPHAAIGAGAHFAMSLIDDLEIRDLRHTEMLAAYVVGVTKERIEGCGKYTAVVSLHNPIMNAPPGQSAQLVRPSQLLTHVSPRRIKKWEDSFGSRWAPRQMKLLMDLIEEELMDDTDISNQP